jgi:hypothetical protein
MRRQPIPDEDKLLPTECPVQLDEELDELYVVKAVSYDPKVQLGSFAVPTIPNDGADRKFLPIERMTQNGSLSTRRPGTSHRWLLGNAAFIKKNYPGSLGFGFFFSFSQVPCFHCWIFVSSRSLARRVGC